MVASLVWDLRKCTMEKEIGQVSSVTSRGRRSRQNILFFDPVSKKIAGSGLDRIAKDFEL
jgi:hypothetical protein